MQDINGIMGKILRIDFQSAGMHHDLAGFQYLHQHQVVGFYKFFPLLLCQVGGTGKAGCAVKYAEQPVVDHLLRVSRHGIGDIL